MTSTDPFARMTIFYTPLARPLLTGPLEAAKCEALSAYAEDYARSAGYIRGPKGEWITELRRDQH